ncbi:MAG: TRAP transporter substrate-binding protein DctP, partial [Desulfatibacillaceae bacterium]
MTHRFPAPVLFAIVLAACLAVPSQVCLGVQWKILTATGEDSTTAGIAEEVFTPALRDGSFGTVETEWQRDEAATESRIALEVLMNSNQAALLSHDGARETAPEVGVLSLPMVFEDIYEVNWIKNEMRSTLEAAWQSRGYQMIGWVDSGFEHVYSVVDGFTTLDDFSDARFLDVRGSVESAFFEGLGATVVDAEGGLSVVDGMVADSVVAGPLALVDEQLYTQLRVSNPLPMRYAPSMLVVSDATWSEIPEEVRQSLYFAARLAEDTATDQLRLAAHNARETMLRFGVLETDMPPEERRQLLLEAERFWQQRAGEFTDTAMFQELLDRLDALRGGGATGREYDEEEPGAEEEGPDAGGAGAAGGDGREGPDAGQGEAGQGGVETAEGAGSAPEAGELVAATRVAAPGETGAGAEAGSGKGYGSAEGQ